MPADAAGGFVYHRVMRRSTIALAFCWMALLLGACAGSGDEKKQQDADEHAPVVSQSGTATKAVAATAPAAATPARSLDEVEKAFEARREAFRRANSARRSQHAGAFNVTVTFAPTGEVVECRMLSTDFRDDPSFNAAVMAEVWRLRIPPRPGAGEFVVSSYPIAFSARSEAVETPPSMPIVSPPPPVGVPVPVP
jgi:zona occludens toxin (predicted ATPase)